LVNCKCAKGASDANYSRQRLLKAIVGKVENGLVVTSDEKVRKLMLGTEAWRRRIKTIVAKSKELDSSKIEEQSKIRRVKLEERLLLLSII
jgi:hypothetical protein